MTDDTTNDESEPNRRQPGDESGPAADPDALADRLRERAATLETTDPTAPLADFDPVGGRLADATVVGLGEATHGTREFFRLKHRAVRYLVEEAGLRAVAMEANFAEALAIDEYVVHGDGDPKAAIDGIYFWTWDTGEVLELVEWLRAFNEGRPVDDRVRFYGVDAQYTAGAAERLTDYLRRVDPAWLDAHRGTLSTLAAEGIEVDWPDDEDDEATTEDYEDEAGPGEAVVAARDLVDALAERFVEREFEYVDATDRDEYDLHRRLVRTLDQAVAYRDLRGRDPQRAIADRDEAMAENVRWVLDHEGADRVALWAHDEHLRRDRRDHEGDALPGTGTHLAEAFGDDYYAVGFDFARGEFRAVGDGELGTFSLGDPPADAATRRPTPRPACSTRRRARPTREPTARPTACCSSTSRPPVRTTGSPSGSTPSARNGRSARCTTARVRPTTTTMTTASPSRSTACCSSPRRATPGPSSGRTTARGEVRGRTTASRRATTDGTGSGNALPAARPTAA